MEFDGLIEQYMSGRIDADMLYDRITIYFKKLFKENKFRELEYLRIYPFLSALLNKDLYEKEVILREEIRRINNILNGKENYIYDVWMTLSPCKISQFHNIWAEYCEKDIIICCMHKKLAKIYCAKKYNGC